MARILVLSLLLTLSKAFMFDQLSDILKCKGITMLCPPMCQRQDARGCSTCDCSHIDPSHPKIPNSGNTGGNTDPSNPLSGHNTIPGSAVCEDWTKCACVPTVNPETGCLECPCGQPQGNHLTKPTLPSTPVFSFSTSASSTPAGSTSGMFLPVSSSSVSQTTSVNHTGISAISTTSPIPPVNSTRNQLKTMSSSSGITGTSPSPYLSTSPRDVTSDSTSAASPGFGFTNLSTKTSTKVDTNLPSIATVPALSTYTTVLVTSTLAPFVCPGVFSCSLDCYAGFANDKNGCPQCKCAPIPTDLP